nr:4'-phosphopantetheinyl transferase superfamily protein [Herbaspirillum sp. LeCh32-8]
MSISHSRGWLACAVGERCAVGVDIEAPSPQRDLAALARLAFSPRELAWLERQPAYEAAFYRLWCAKEALYKLRHNSGLRDMQELPELECGGDNSGDSGVNEGDAAQAISAPDAFLRHDATADYHLCLCSAATPTRHSVEHLECDRLLNLSAA